MRPDLAEVLRKRASYSLNNSTAMNVILDRAQGFAYAVPSYVAHAETLLRERFLAQG